MNASIGFTPVCSLVSPSEPGLGRVNFIGRDVVRVNNVYKKYKGFSLRSLKVKASDSGKNVKTSSIICTDCEGNGAKVCTQCKGSGVNATDAFNGRFKAGALCWLCRGKREILCGNCNGAGFIGGFMSTFDD